MPELPVPTTITLTPAADYAIAGIETQVITTTVKDQLGNVVPGVEVEFRVATAEGSLSNKLDAVRVVTDSAGQATVEWSQSLGDWGAEGVVASIGSSPDEVPDLGRPTSDVSLMRWAYVDGTGTPGQLVSAKRGTQQVEVYAGYAPWNSLTLVVLLKPDEVANELGSAVYSDAVDSFISTRHHTWAEGQVFFVTANNASDRIPTLVYAVAE